MFTINNSYRKATEQLNRIRNQEESGTPIRTVQSTIEQEGNKYHSCLQHTASEILQENNFTTEGTPNDASMTYGKNIVQTAIPTSNIDEAIKQYNQDKELSACIPLEMRTKRYENELYSTNISMDDVCVKKQVGTRCKSDPQTLKYVRNTVVHIEKRAGKKKEKYHLNEVNTVNVFNLIVAFLLNNRLVDDYLMFFVDGERSLHESIRKHMSWHSSWGLLLDWYHLQEKCKMELSLSIKGRELRNQYLEAITKILWLGKTTEAIEYLRTLPQGDIKSLEHIERLIGYIERNISIIPCYALRKQLGLRNSSNRGEKANHLLVSERQKHNGMSWSKEGSFALATITCMSLNGEAQRFIRQGEINFKLIA